MKAYGFRDILFALLLPTREAHTTAEGNITHEVHRSRRRRVKTTGSTGGLHSPYKGQIQA